MTRSLLLWVLLLQACVALFTLASDVPVLHLRSPAPGCVLSVCACNTGAAMCAKNRTGITFQYPDCLEKCFRSCCLPSEAPHDVRSGPCTAPVFAEVITEIPQNTTVGLLEACPGIYLAAVDRYNN